MSQSVSTVPPYKLLQVLCLNSEEPKQCMTHDNSFPVATKFMSIGASKIHDNRQVVMTLDHDVQNKSEANLKKYTAIENFAKQHGVDFYPAGRGIGHQIMVEEGYAWPGTVAVASDSHSNMYGGVGCLGMYKSYHPCIHELTSGLPNYRHASGQDRCCVYMGNRPNMVAGPSHRQGHIHRTSAPRSDWKGRDCCPLRSVQQRRRS